MAAGRSPFSEVPPKTNCQPRHRPSRALARLADADLSAQPGDADLQRFDLRQSGTRLACQLNDKIDQLPRGVGVRVAGQMPHKSERLGM